MAFEEAGELVATGGEIISGTGEVLEKTGDMVAGISPRDCGELAILGILGAGLGFLGYKAAEYVDEKLLNDDSKSDDEVEKMSKLLEQLYQKYNAQPQTQATLAAADTQPASQQAQAQAQTVVPPVQPQAQPQDQPQAQPQN